MDLDQSTATKQQGSGLAPSFKLAAVVIVAYITLVAFVTAAPLLLHRSLAPSSWVRNSSLVELPQASMSFDSLTQLASSLPRVANSNITKLIHQSYKSRVLPADYAHFQASWVANHPTSRNWTYQFWTDEDNLRLVSEHFSWFMDTYQGLPTTISRADAARYMYMYIYGGVYADLDMESLKPIDPLLEGKDAVLGYMGEPDGFIHNIPNAWMASRPGHPFWLLMLKRIQQVDKHQDAEYITGPIALKQCVEGFWQPMNGTSSGKVTVVDGQYIYPFDWSRSKGAIRKFCSDSYKLNPFFDPRKCKALLPNSYTVTYWSHGWSYSY